MPSFTSIDSLIDLYAVNFVEELLCLQDQSYTLTNNVVLNRDDLNDLLSIVLCE